MRYLFTRSWAYWSAIICLLILGSILALLFSTQINAARGQPIDPATGHIDWVRPTTMHPLSAGKQSRLMIGPGLSFSLAIGSSTSSLACSEATERQTQTFPTLLAGKERNHRGEPGRRLLPTNQQV